MSRTHRSIGPLTGLAIVFVLCTQAAAQFSESLRFDAYQIGRPAEAPTYELRVAAFFGPNEKLITPRGTVFPTLTGRFEVNNFSEFAQEFFGDWTILEHVVGPTGSDSEYSFNFAPFTLDEVYAITPTIVEPANGASVPPTFFLEWQFPSGTPSARSISYRPGNVAETSFDPTGAHRVRFAIDRDLLANRPLTIYAGSSEPLDDRLGPVTLKSGPGRTNYSLTPSRFWNFAEVTVNVVPEPSLAGMFLSSAFLLACRRRKSGR